MADKWVLFFWPTKVACLSIYVKLFTIKKKKKNCGHQHIVGRPIEIIMLFDINPLVARMVPISIHLCLKGATTQQ